MRIAYIDHYAGGPSLGMEYRPHAMALEWKRLGDETTIIAGTYSHLRKQNFQDTKPDQLYEIDGAQFQFIKTRAYEGNGLGRILSMFDFVGGGIWAAHRIAEQLRPDAIIASSTYPFDTYFAQRLAKITGAMLVHEIHDLWPLTPIELGGHSPNHPLMRAMSIAERSAYRNSAAIVSILPNTEPYVRSLGINTPVISIPNGIDFVESPKPSPDDFITLVARLRAEGKTVVGYAGGMTNANAMDDFVAAMGLINDKPIAAVLIGDGLFREDLIRQSVSLEANIKFYGTLPKEQIHDALTHCDLLYIGSKKSPLYKYGVSANKIFDYMATGVPIVNAFASEHSPMVYADCSIRAEGENPSAIARALIEASQLSAEKRAELGTRAINWVKQHHSMPELARLFRDVLFQI